MRAVNLLPRETNGRKFGLSGELAAGIGFTVLIAAAVLGGFIVERSQAGTERQRLAAAQAAYANAVAQRPAKQTVLQPPAVLSQTEPWHLALDSALATRVSWDVLLSQLEYVVPPKVVLTSVDFSSAAGSTAASAPTSATVSLGGSAYTLHDVAVFLSTLSRVPRLSQVTLMNTAATGTGAKTVQTFQITAQVTLPTAPAPPAAPTTTTTSGGQT